MARRLGVTLVGLSIIGLLAGCGVRMFAQRDAWRGQAEDACLAQKHVSATAYTEPMAAINGPGTCGMDHPFRVTALAGGTVAVSTRAVLACPVISTIDVWLAEVVQPAAQAYFGLAVVELKSGSYSCRSINSRANGKASEHSFGNAVDLMGLRLADGRYISVERGWRGDSAEQDFLREIFTGACRHFSTVLGPGSDVFHYNHFHMDLARRSSRRSVCKPVLKWTSPLVASAAGGYREAAAATPVARDYGARAAAPGYGAPLPAPAPQRAYSPPRESHHPVARGPSPAPTQPASLEDEDEYGIDDEGPDPAAPAPRTSYEPPARPAPTYVAPRASYEPPARPAPTYAPPPMPMNLRPPGTIGGSYR